MLVCAELLMYNLYMEDVEKKAISTLYSPFPTPEWWKGICG